MKKQSPIKLLSFGSIKESISRGIIIAKKEQWSVLLRSVDINNGFASKYIIKPSHNSVRQVLKITITKGRHNG